MIEHVFTLVSAAIGPVGAIFLMLFLWTLNRLFQMQDKSEARNVALATFQADILHAIETLTALMRQTRN